MMFVCGFSVAYSQVQVDYLFTKIQELTLANDSLQKELKLKHGSLNANIRFYNDSISRLIAAHKTEITDLKSNLSKTEKDLADANKKVTALDKSTVKTERDNLQKQVDSLKFDTATLRQQLSEKDKQAQEQYKAGRQNALSQIERNYQGNFDNLIESSTKQSVKRDLLLIENDTTKKKLQNLQKYFDAKQVLSEQYNEQRVKSAQRQAVSLEQTPLVELLITKLGEYKLCNDGLKSVIEKICKQDKILKANNPDLQDKKKANISFILLRYFYDYPSFSFTDYPYLSNIVLEIINRKQENADTDISDLSSKLVDK